MVWKVVVRLLKNDGVGLFFGRYFLFHVLVVVVGLEWIDEGKGVPCL